MITEPITISRGDTQKLLSASSPDAALLYLFLAAGNRPEDAAQELNISDSRLQCAGATLRQLGLWPEQRPSHIAPASGPAIPSRMCSGPWTRMWISGAFTGKSSGCWDGP